MPKASSQLAGQVGASTKCWLDGPSFGWLYQLTYMRAIAEVPGSTCELYSVRKLTKRYRQQQKEQKRNNKQENSSAANWFILSVEGEKFNIDKKNRVLYRTVPEFIRLINKAKAAAMCPGYP